jgi:hypothetical protein
MIYCCNSVSDSGNLLVFHPQAGFAGFFMAHDVPFLAADI